jgi:hypothetical protein
MSFILALLQVRWSTPSEQGLRIEALDREQDIIECLESSHQARLRFEMRLCRRRSGWLDYCEEARSELHTAQFDEVTESYRVVSDRFGDESESTAVEVPARQEAVKVTRTLPNMPLSFMLRDEPSILDNPNAYLQIRTIFICRGGISRTIAHLSRVLTLGLVNNVEDRSDWEDFPLKGYQRGTAH